MAEGPRALGRGLGELKKEATGFIGVPRMVAKPAAAPAPAHPPPKDAAASAPAAAPWPWMALALAISLAGCATLGVLLARATRAKAVEPSAPAPASAVVAGEIVDPVLPVPGEGIPLAATLPPWLDGLSVDGVRIERAPGSATLVFSSPVFDRGGQLLPRPATLLRRFARMLRANATGCRYTVSASGGDGFDRSLQRAARVAALLQQEGPLPAESLAAAVSGRPAAGELELAIGLR
jgi:hypothetical protein